MGLILLFGDKDVSQTPTREKELRGEPDAVADWVVLVEGYDRSAVEQVKAELLGIDGLLDHGANANLIAGLYTLDYTLEEKRSKADLAATLTLF